jgi:cyanamide hydratase
MKHFPRTGWSACFANTIRQETTVKPWAHTTALGVEKFQAAVMGNEVMKEYE